MRKLLNDCTPWLTWKAAVALAAVVLAIAFVVDLPRWTLWVSATPLLGLAICLLPCLIPLLFLWRKGGHSPFQASRLSRHSEQSQ